MDGPVGDGPCRGWRAGQALENLALREDVSAAPFEERAGAEPPPYGPNGPQRHLSHADEEIASFHEPTCDPIEHHRHEKEQRARIAGAQGDARQEVERTDIRPEPAVAARRETEAPRPLRRDEG